MNICDNCMKLGKKAEDAFSKLERVQMLTSTATMMRWLEANPNCPEQDKIVGSSITTKLLLSFDEQTRAGLLQGLRQVAGVDIKLPKSCPHGILNVVS